MPSVCVPANGCDWLGSCLQFVAWSASTVNGNVQFVLQHLQHVDTAAAQYNPPQVVAVLDLCVHSQALPGDCTQMCVIEHKG